MGAGLLRFSLSLSLSLSLVWGTTSAGNDNDEPSVKLSGSHILAASEITWARVDTPGITNGKSKRHYYDYHVVLLNTLDSYACTTCKGTSANLDWHVQGLEFMGFQRIMEIQMETNVETQM